MSAAQIFFKFRENEMFTQVLSASAATLNAAIRASREIIREQVASLVVTYIEQCPEIQSMRGGELQAELGFIAPERFIKGLLEGIREAVTVEFIPYKLVGKQFVGGLTVKIFPNGLADLLSLDISTYESNGYNIDWLKWLLESGTDIVVADFHIIHGDFPNSRSRRATMKPTGSYSIPAQYAGRENDNFITRALDVPGAQEKFGSTLQNLILGNING